MKRQALHGILAIAVLAAYSAVSLYPFGPIQWQFPRKVANGAEVVPQGGIRFAQPGTMRSSVPPQWAVAAMRSHRLQLSLGVRSIAPDQDGPARILTLSADPLHRNLTIGQAGDDLIVRLRTPATDLNGTLPDNAPVARVPGVFRTPAWLDVRVGVEPGRLQVEVGRGVRVDRDLPAEPLRNWDPSYRLALGNELTNDRPWLGEIRHAVVSVGGHAVDYAARHVLELSPLRFWYVPHRFTLVPFGENDSPRIRLVDAAINLVGYIPLGLLLGLWARGRGRSRRRHVLLLVLATSAVSAGLETLQFGVGSRHPSTTDLMLNTLGGGIGVVLALWAKPIRPLRLFASTRFGSSSAQTSAPERVN